MDSRGAETGDDAAEVRRHAAARGLGSRRGLRLAAIALWSSFLGATLTLLAALALLPLEHAGLTEVSLGFFCAWALALVPVTIALMLSHVPDRP